MWKDEGPNDMQENIRHHGEGRDKPVFRGIYIYQSTHRQETMMSVEEKRVGHGAGYEQSAIVCMQDNGVWRSVLCTTSNMTKTIQ